MQLTLLQEALAATFSGLRYDIQEGFDRSSICGSKVGEDAVLGRLFFHLRIHSFQRSGV